MKSKSYEEILEEYEQFFNLDEELNKGSSNAVNSGSVEGANIFNLIELTFAETIVGATQVVGFNRIILCNSCEGKKVKPLNKTDQCPLCKGTGENLELIGDLCPKCLGTGL